MKSKLLKSSVSLLLAVLLCVSLITPSAFAAAAGDTGLAAVGADGDVIEKHAPDAAITMADVMSVFGDESSTDLYYGIAAAAEPDSITNVTSSSSPGVTAGEYIAYKTTAYTGSRTRKADWTQLEQRSSLSFSVRTYYNATFVVRGCSDGALCLDGEVVEGTAKLYYDGSYVITAQAVEGYNCTVNGVTEGEQFTPDADITVTADYIAVANAPVTLEVGEGGSAKIMFDGEDAIGPIPAGKTFTVVATPKEHRGYKLDSIVVTKDGVAVDPVEGTENEYGPVADGESYVATVSFVYDPAAAQAEIDANSAKVNRSVLSKFLGSFSYYGIAKADSPDQISNLKNSNSTYTVEAGDYFIYGSNQGSSSSPQWGDATLMALSVRLYYNASFTVGGNPEGEIYLNGEAVGESAKLFTDTEYTVTAKAVEEYGYTLTGAEDGAVFTPSADIDVIARYIKNKNASVSLTFNEGGTAELHSDGMTLIDRVSEGSTFTVNTKVNTNRGYKLDSIVVTKDGEVIEPVEGSENEFGPAVENAVYEVTVNFVFDPHVVNYEVNAASPKLYVTDFNSMFNGSTTDLLTCSYGYAPANDPDNIKTVGKLSSVTLAPGEYYIFRSTSGSSWGNAKLYKLRLRSYYKATFEVSGHEEGEVYLNGEAVSGNVKLYTDTAYTVTTKHIDEYICTVYGVTEGEEFTPSAALEVTAAYAKERYATFTASSNEGGSVEVKVNGETAIEKISEGENFVVVPKANSDNDYYPQSITVTKDGVAVEPVDGTDNEFGPVSDGEVYEITVTFAAATLTVNDCDVILMDIKNGDYNAVAQSILANAVITPAEFTELAQGSVQYAAYNILGIEIYEPLNYKSDLSHDFGTSTRGGELLEGNTEKVRVTIKIPDYDLELRATAAVTVIDTREHCRVECGDRVTITYGDDLKAALIGQIAVFNASDEPVEFTEDDIVLEPAVPNAGDSEVTVRYNGSDIYAVSKGTAQVHVNRAKSSLKIENETITYGETPSTTVVTDPEGLDHMLVIAGIDGDAQGFVDISIPESVRERMKFKLGDIVLLDIYDSIRSYIGEGTDLNGFKELLNSLYETINSSDSIREAVSNSGFDMQSLDAIMNFINQLPSGNLDVVITLDRVPTDAGAYLVSAFSTDSNYTFSSDVAYLFIKRASGEEDGVVLRFKTEFEEGQNVITYDDAQEFEFGGDLYVNDELVETTKIRTFYTGITLNGAIIAQEEPVREPGAYTESIYILSGNYMPSPIERSYTIRRNSAELTMEDLTVEYDGESHALEAFFEDEALADSNITYTYVGTSYLSSRAPSNAGEYTVTARYQGDDTHRSSEATAKLTITRRQAVISVTCEEQVAYGEITTLDSSAANVDYTVSGVLEGDSLGYIVPSLKTSGIVPGVGEYTATVTLLRANTNYAVTIEDAVLSIVPRSATITITPAEKTFGGSDPRLTYTTENVLRTDKAVVTLTREEGEDAGEYAINAEVTPDPNYSYTVVPAVFTINPKPIFINIKDAEKTYGEDDPKLSYTTTDANGKRILTDLVITLARAEGTDAGEYEITANVEPNANYAVTADPAVFTINPKAINVKVNNAEKFVDEEDPELTFKVTDAKGKPVECEIEFTAVRAEGAEAGEYEITVQYEENANYAVTVTPGVFKINAQPVAYIVGDVNGDGEVNNRDAMILDRYIGGWEGYDQYIVNPDAADINNDGEVNNRDAMILDRYIAGWEGYDKWIVEV